MAIVSEWTLQTVLDLEACKGTEDAYVLEYPCGLRVDTRVQIPGVFWGAFRAVHQSHHGTGCPESPWTIWERIETSGDNMAVTLTFSCRGSLRGLRA